MATIYKPIITRIDTTANWTTLNPVPRNGEQCIEILGGGLFKLKIGDGVSPWIALDYYQGSSGSVEDLSKLITPDKSSLVAAINSVQRQINDIVERLAGLADVAHTGDYNDLVNKLIAGEGITIDENNVISATGGPVPPTPVVYEEYFPEIEQLLIHGVVIVSDDDGYLIMDGVNGEIIPIYEEDGHETDINDNIIYDGDIQVVSDTDSDIVLDNVDNQIIPIVDDSHESDIDDNIVYDGDIQVISDTDSDIVLSNVNDQIIPIVDDGSNVVTNYSVVSDDDGNLVLSSIGG